MLAKLADLMAAVPVVDKMLAGEEVDERKDMVHAGNEQADAQKTKGESIEKNRRLLQLLSP